MSFNRLIILCLILSLSKVNSQDATYISPGIKLGYAFGENGGFVFGVELSITQYTEEDFIYGVVISIDHMKDIVIFHAGLEATGDFALGLELGPSLMIQNGEKSFGFGITPYTGFIILPYFNYSCFSKFPHYFQIGGYFKIPIHAGGPKFSFGG